MATKTFKIGEYAKGGIIKVEIKGKVILIKALDLFSGTKEVISSGSVMSDDREATRKLDNYLNELTSSYYADKVMKWIKSKVEFKIVY